MLYKHLELQLLTFPDKPRTGLRVQDMRTPENLEPGAGFEPANSGFQRTALQPTALTAWLPRHILLFVKTSIKHLWFVERECLVYLTYPILTNIPLY